MVWWQHVLDKKGERKMKVLSVMWLSIRAVLFMVCSVVFDTSACIILLFPWGSRKGAVAKWHTSTWAKICLKLARVTVEVENSDGVDLRLPPYVIVFNHTSTLDIIVLLSMFPWPSVWVVKRVLMWIPIFGWAMYLVGYISTKRGHDARKVSRKTKKVLLKRKWCVLSFPEGTRSLDGLVGKKFSRVIFQDAIEAEVPVLYGAISGAFEIWPKGQFLPHGGKKVRVRYGEVVQPSRFNGNPSDFRDYVRDKIVELHEDMKA